MKSPTNLTDQLPNKSSTNNTGNIKTSEKHVITEIT